MDEVPIVTSNPVKPVFHSPAPPPAQKPKPPGTFILFFLVMPFAMVVLTQAFFLGKTIGDHTTFPIHTFQSYLTLGAVISLMVVMQVLMRSIMYSTLFAFILLSGILHSWFGEFWVPLIQNFKEVVYILKSSWSKRDIPFPVLMSTILTLLVFATAGANFILSLFVKYFFEVIFGREWSDGKRFGFISAIIILGICQATFILYTRHAGNLAAQKWAYRDIYKPLEEFITRIPGGVQVTKNSICAIDPVSISALNPATGEKMKTQQINTTILTPSWANLDNPILGTRDYVVGFDKDLLFQSWTCKLPVKLPLESIPGLGSGEKDKGGSDSEGGKENLEEIGIPLILRPDISRDYILAMFDFGFWGAISGKDGKVLWTKLIDTPAKINRFSLEEFLKNSWLIGNKDLLFFSCTNGRVAAVKSGTGEIIWEYSHKDTKHSGKGQRAQLSISNDRIYLAFPSGAIETLDLNKGTRIYETRSVGSKWSPVSAAVCDNHEATFISVDGSLVRVQLDGSDVVMQIPLFENRLPLMPTPFNLEDGFAGYKDNFYSISSSTKSLKTVKNFSKHIFATNPVVDGNYVYVGTQDGWVFCFHKGSFDEKWRYHVNGELTEDSLFKSDEAILVKTRSGSIYALKKGEV